MQSTARIKKIEELVRMGLLPVDRLALLKKAVSNMESDMFLPLVQRKIFYEFIQKFLDLTLSDVTISRLIKMRVQRLRYEQTEDDNLLNIQETQMKTSKNILKSFYAEDIEMKKAPEGMLTTYANLVKQKIRAGGKPSEGDKKLASMAKNELRRRRNVASKRMSEGVEYEAKVRNAMKKFGINSLKELPDDKKKEFFTYLDSIHKAKGE
jgi:hypothetical protein